MLIDLRRNKPGGKLYARQFVHKIEQAIINVLGAYNLVGERVEGAPGIYMAGGPKQGAKIAALGLNCLLYTSPSPRDGLLSRMPSSA